MSIAQFIEQADDVGTPEELFSLLISSAATEGFPFVAYGALNYRESRQLAEALPPFLAINYPKGWQHWYAKQRYSEIDPIVVHTPQIACPYLWKWLPRWFCLDPRQKRIMEEASAAGLKNGVSVPLHGPWGKVAVVSFASSDEIGRPEGQLWHLAALATQFHASFVELDTDERREPVRLSEREKDCLHWTAQGKSSWDMSAILSISENTVNFHIKNAMRKLETTSRTVAVIKALRMGLIEVPDW